MPTDTDKPHTITGIDTSRDNRWTIAYADGTNITGWITTDGQMILTSGTPQRRASAPRDTIEGALDEHIEGNSGLKIVGIGPGWIDWTGINAPVASASRVLLSDDHPTRDRGHLHNRFEHALRETFTNPALNSYVAASTSHAHLNELGRLEAELAKIANMHARMTDALHRQEELYAAATTRREQLLDEMTPGPERP